MTHSSASFHSVAILSDMGTPRVHGKKCCRARGFKLFYWEYLQIFHEVMRNLYNFFHVWTMQCKLIKVILNSKPEFLKESQSPSFLLNFLLIQFLQFPINAEHTEDKLRCCHILLIWWNCFLYLIMLAFCIIGFVMCGVVWQGLYQVISTSSEVLHSL